MKTIQQIINDVKPQVINIIRKEINSVATASVEDRDAVLQSLLDVFSFQLGALISFSIKIGMNSALVLQFVSNKIHIGQEISNKNMEKAIVGITNSDGTLPALIFSKLN